MNLSKVLTLIIFTAFVCACRPAVKPPATANNRPNNLNKPAWEISSELAKKAEKNADKQEKARLAKEGIASAEECVMKLPETAECYYYHAVNTGIYYSAHITGYQNGIKTMIEDCKTVIKLNDKFDHGGAYRIIGKIYTDLPETTLAKGGVTKNLSLAIENLKKAIAIDDTYPENYIYLAEAFLEAERLDEARVSLSTATALVPQWRNHSNYVVWKNTNKKLSEKLKQ